MKIDTLGLQAFLAIADAGNFVKAAESLFITQTALTRRLQNLESFLGVELVERTTRSMSLTTIGRDFLPQARRLMSELAAALVEIRETGKAIRGEVSIACVPTVGVQFLPRLIQAYSARHPDNRINILDHASSGVVQAVLRHEAEFGISIGGSLDPDLETTPLLHDRFVLICRDDHPLGGKRSLSWRQIQSYPLIVAGEISGNRPLLDAALGAQQVVLKSHYRVQRSSTAVGLVAQGVAAAIVPQLAIQKGAYPRLRVIPLIHPVVSRELVLLRRRNAYLSPAAEALYELIRRPSGRPGSEPTLHKGPRTG